MGSNCPPFCWAIQSIPLISLIGDFIKLDGATKWSGVEFCDIELSTTSRALTFSIPVTKSLFVDCI